jgi:hypothetical protein
MKKNKKINTNILLLSDELAVTRDCDAQTCLIILILTNGHDSQVADA